MKLFFLLFLILHLYFDSLLIPLVFYSQGYIAPVYKLTEDLADHFGFVKVRSSGNCSFRYELPIQEIEATGGLNWCIY